MLMVATMLAATAAAQTQQIGYIEDFALAQDRQEALKQLIPGSEDYYYYHCLQLQHTEQFDQVEALLQTWIKRYKQTPRVVEIQNRQALLTYAQNPAESLEQIRRHLNIRFNHQRETVGQKPNLSTQLDPARISREQLTQRALARHRNLAGFEPTALDWLVRAELNPVRRRHLLELLQRPDHANLPELVVADLKHRDSKPFGTLAIHRQLLRDQLDACLELKPDLLNQQNFVHIYLSKLRPNADLDWRHDPADRAAYLDRLWGFVERLAPVHNSLKAHVLYRRLHHDRAQGVYDKQRFMTYIRLPRNVGYIEPRFMQLEQNRRYPANLQADFRELTLFPIVGSDEELVRSFLQHYFIEEMAIDPYQPYINDAFLRHQLAEAKIVNGLGEPEQWYSLLPPARYQALKERIDIEFAHTNPPHFAAGDEVSLDLYVKNVRTLIVKVFQINAQNYYGEHHREVNTDINLDGLVANDEFSFAYIEPPLRRVRRHFAFPKLQQRGVYVIDFIGNGMSSRVVVRKGKLRHLVGATLAGQRFTVLDEANALVKDARISLGGRTFTAGDDGRILVPYSTAPARQPIVISDGTFSALDSFQHAAEDYRLAAGMFVDRESLLNRRTSQLVVRPALYLNGTPVSLSALQEVILTITSKDHQGVLSSQRIKDFKLYEDRESLHTFQTPPRLSQITFQLQAKVPSRSQNKQIDLAVTETFGLNQIDQSDKVEDLHFANIDGEYFLELLGKTGEPRPDRPVQLAVKHRDFRQPVNLALQTDLAGRVELGPLTDIVSVTATGPEKTAHTWNLPLDRHSYHASLHGVAGETLELPYLGRAEQPSRSEFSLLEMRGETYVADRFDALSIEDGMLRIEELPRGDYQLLLKHSGQPVRIRLTAGVARAGYALGANRHLEQRGVRPLQIVDIDRGREKIRVRLRNASKFARVHVFATRYQPAFSAFAKLGRIVDPEPLRRSVAQTSSLYVAGRNIGDEYRYIIDRRYANKYPGVMIERPSLLLNAWPLRSTQTKQQTAEEGTKFAPQAEALKEQAERDAESQKRAQAGGDFANLDFLSESSALLLNLAPNKRGVVVIPNEAVGAHQHLHVVAVDPQSTVYRSISLSETPTDFLDLRLAKGLDPERHFTQQKQISVVERGDTFVLADVTTSKLKSYDSLGSVYSLYATLTGDAHLLQFGFVLN
ncbi:MAG: hypothetical protein VX346_11210, partial [Planctomycetota bacterium]|nr:hypothetical protein [Planctomycetota bacterium]